MSSWRQKYCSFSADWRKCLFLALNSGINPLYTGLQRGKNFVHDILPTPLLCPTFQESEAILLKDLEKA